MEKEFWMERKISNTPLKDMYFCLIQQLINWQEKRMKHDKIVMISGSSFPKIKMSSCFTKMFFLFCYSRKTSTAIRSTTERR